MNKILFALSALLAACVGGKAAAYDIIAPRLHEAFTQAAWNCWQAAKKQGAQPDDCRAQRPEIQRLSKLQYSLSNVQREVRWPDDPRREIKSLLFFRPAVQGKMSGCLDTIERGRA